jgi:hypothetical protein
MFIYLIVNRATGKYYVGQHKGSSLKQYLQKKRWEAKHKTASRSHLYASMRKHNDPHLWSIHALLSDVQTRAELDQHEKDFIAFLRSQDHDYGYNICRGGEGFTGPHTEETRNKIAEASKRMWNGPMREILVPKLREHSLNRSPEVMAKITAANCARAGQSPSPETIQKLRDSHIGIASPRRKPILCLDTDEVFQSLTNAVERFGGCTTNLSRAIKCGHKFFGKRFKYAQST